MYAANILKVMIEIMHGLLHIGDYFIRVIYTHFAYRIAQNFDGYWLFNYLPENILTDGHCLSPYTCKRCIVFKQSDGRAGERQNVKISPRQNFALYGN